MTPTSAIGVLFALSALAVATFLGWALVAMVVVGRRLTTDAQPAWPASLVAQLRLLPLGLATVVVTAQVTAFIRYESGGAETAGPLLLALGAIGAALLIDALGRGVRSWLDTRAVVGSWRSSASPLSVPTWSRRAWAMNRPFPVVAVVGIMRPQLFVARQVAAGCTAGELAAIAAHEAAHVAARDNLIRLLFELTPGARLFRGIAVALERSWMVAAEEAADMTARRTASDLDLASALTKVARLAVGSQPEVVAASGLIGGAELASRVRRLCDGTAPPARRQFGWAPALAILATVVVTILATPTLRLLHDLFEGLVRR